MMQKILCISLTILFAVCLHWCLTMLPAAIHLQSDLLVLYFILLGMFGLGLFRLLFLLKREFNKAEAHP